jgi:hypothetical protein
MFKVNVKEYFDLEDYFSFGGSYGEDDYYCGSKVSFCLNSEQEPDNGTYGICKLIVAL